VLDNAMFGVTKEGLLEKTQLISGFPLTVQVLWSIVNLNQDYEDSSVPNAWADIVTLLVSLSG
jgi:hypothetical protein